MEWVSSLNQLQSNPILLSTYCIIWSFLSYSEWEVQKGQVMPDKGQGCETLSKQDPRTSISEQAVSSYDFIMNFSEQIEHPLPTEIALQGLSLHFQGTF